MVENSNRTTLRVKDQKDENGYTHYLTLFHSNRIDLKIPDFKSLSHDTLISLLMNYSDYLRGTPFKYRPKCGKAQKIKIALLLHSDRLK